MLLHCLGMKKKKKTLASGLLYSSNYCNGVFFIEPVVLSKYNMDVQGCLCTLVLGDYLLKVIWDHSVPLIIPESIQHLHLFWYIHRSTSKTKAASAG